MTFAAGHTLSHYEILGPLGAGAMGEVYRARDKRLEREVALKVLPDELAHDEDRLRRFEREAKTLASLNHPNVAQVFAIDRVDATCFMAMELVPGEDLAARLSRGPLPVDEAVGLCRQVAEGLEASHEAGVVHRDLKPANVVLTPEGKVKVLDFGLAKPARHGAAESSRNDSALTTEEGRLLGTPAYMAPEQARGRPIDKRVDVWAFGCVLYECLAGRRPFDGETTGDVFAAVLEKEPDWSALPVVTSGRLRELLERCLCKDVRRRLRDVGEARILLEDLATGIPSVSIPAPQAGGRGILVTLLAATSVVAVGFALWSAGSKRDAESPTVKTVKPLTNSPVWTVAPSWSPRGEFIAYSEMTAEGMDVFVKPTSGGIPELRARTPGDDVSPRISPDGSTLAFVSSGEPGSPVWVVGVQDDRPMTRLVDTRISTLDVSALLDSLGDRPWSLDGRSLLASIVDASGRMGVHRVELASGEATQLTFPKAGHDDRAASLSFDGERIVFHREGASGSSLWTMPARGGEPTAMLPDDDAANYSPAWRPDGERVVFRRMERGGYYDLWEANAVTRDMRRITWETRRVWSLSVAADDRIAFTSSDHDTFLHTVSRTGESAPRLVNAHTGDNFGARPSPAGNKIAYHSNREGDPELWLFDTRGGPETRLTRDPATDLFPDWSPDGRQLAFVSNAAGAFHVYVLDIEKGTRRRIVDEPLSVLGSNIINATIFARWSPDADDPRIAFILSGDRGHALWTVRPDGSDRKRVLDDVEDFDWYQDGRRGLITRHRDDGRMDLLAVHLASGASRLLATLPHTELAVAPDGTAVSFCSGPGHLSMDLFVLELEPPADAQGLPTAVGEPIRRTDGEGRWHAHNGGWFPDSRTLVFTRDEDYGEVFELIEER